MAGPKRTKRAERPLASGGPALRLAEAALSELLGAALLLDSQLRICVATDEARALLGGADLLGERAPHVLCGRGGERPIAEALSRGEPASALVPHPLGSEGDLIAARTIPLHSAGKLSGHVVLLQPARSPPGSSVQHGILTQSESMFRLLEQVRRVAPSHSSVLVRGETGTGKELVARAIHAESPRKRGPFLAINCAALPPELLESELFGHVRGAFTGAVRDTLGYFRRADGGTLFLDEVAELPLALQAKLLRVTQERVVVPVGGTEPVAVDVRIVSATHRSLRDEVKEGRFRADLMYRLRVLRLFLPPLRARQEDIELLAWHFLERLNRSGASRKVERIAPGALRRLVNYGWPGNVRELENAIEYAFTLGDGPTLLESDLPEELAAQASSSPTPLAMLELDPGLAPEARRLLLALERADGSRERAAQSLGMSRTTLWRKLKSFGLDAR